MASNSFDPEAKVIRSPVTGFSITSPGRGSGEYLIEPDGGTGARVTIRVGATTSAGFAIIAPLIRKFLEHDASGNVAGLKRLLEAES